MIFTLVECNVAARADFYIDIMDYIQPATCTEVQFRVMWAEFEWENKVAVVTSITDVNKYLDHIGALLLLLPSVVLSLPLVKATNMKCLTPPPEENCVILAANLYARSIFGTYLSFNTVFNEQH